MSGRKSSSSSSSSESGASNIGETPEFGSLTNSDRAKILTFKEDFLTQRNPTKKQDLPKATKSSKKGLSRTINSKKKFDTERQKVSTVVGHNESEIKDKFTQLEEEILGL